MTTGVRRATDEDADAIVALWREMMELHQQVEPAMWTMSADAEQAFRRYLGQCLADTEHLLAVAVRGGEVVGFIHAAQGARPPVLHPPAEGLIQGCCVTEGARRQGVGGALVAYALEWFRRQDLTLARAGWAVNNPLSGPFWVAQGFRPYMLTGVRQVGDAD